MSNYIEQEVKVIDVDVATICLKLDQLGAQKVFDGERLFTYFDYTDGRLRGSGEEVRLTEEGKLKLSFSRKVSEGKETIKVFVSKKEEISDFLSRLGLVPIAEIQSRRISYEWGSIDFDIDIFPKIPAFLEIDLGSSAEKSLPDLISYLELADKERLEISTQEIYSKFGVDIFNDFKI